MEAQQILAAFVETVAAIKTAIGHVDEWGESGLREGQYNIDVAADSAARTVLEGHGLSVLSEESGSGADLGPVVVVLDPIDGSTNAALGLPWYGPSLCAVDEHGPWVAMVQNLASGVRFSAIRGQGAWRGSTPISTSDTGSLADAFVAVSGLPHEHFGWKQFRCYGAAALDIAAVASGVFDGFVDTSVDAHGVWDYLAGCLICTEAGGVVADAKGRDLLTLDHTQRRTPVAAATPQLLSEILGATGLR